MAILPVPKETQSAFRDNNSTSENAYLLLNRFLEGKNERNKSFDTQKTQEELYSKIQGISFDFKPHVMRTRRLLDRLSDTGLHVRSFELSTVTRIVVGLGDTNALEVGFTLHPLYGFPYIPGSSLKGLCRTWLEIGENTFDGKEIIDEEDLNKAISNESRVVFGSFVKDPKEPKKIDEDIFEAYNQDNQSSNKLGDVIFLDSLPSDETKFGFEIDIMNPHYSKYYSEPGKHPPGDWYSPVPIKFLTLKPETTFLFSLVSRNEESLVKAKKWLISGLSDLGIGAKTSSGYGLFSETDLEEVKRQEKIKEEKEKQENIEKLRAEADQLAKKVKSPLETFNERLDSASKEDLGDLVYNSWKMLKTDEEKIDGAKRIRAKFKKVLEKKAKNKKFAQEILEWSEK